MAALGFSLSAMALISLIRFRISSQNVDISTKAERLRLFKRESKTVPLEVHASSSGSVRLKLVSVRGGEGIECELTETEGGQRALQIRTRYAGTWKGIAAEFQVIDPLGLFAKRITVSLDLTIESLPLALKGPPAPMMIRFLSYGETPSGRRGPGLELYGVGRYGHGMDPRDIMWKKAASMSDDTLPMRERETNIRHKVLLLVAVESGPEPRRARINDLVAEAIGQVGKQLISAGSTVELQLAGSHGRNQRLRASTLRDLAEATLLPWTCEQLEGGSLPNVRPDLLITGAGKPMEELAPLSTRSRYTLLISEGGPSADSVPRGVTVFSGGEELAQLATSVLVG